MIRICHVTSVHKSTDVRILEKECTSLAKDGRYEVFLVARGDGFTRNQVTVVGAGDRPPGRLRRMLFFSKKVVKKALEVNADVYHLHDPELLRYVGLLKRKGKIVIFDSHENVAESIHYKPYIPKPFRTAAAKFYESYAGRRMKRCDALISVTPHYVEKLEKYNDTVEMITNYPILGKVLPEVPGRYASRKILFAGRVFPDWSHDLILDALNELDGGTYELYGRADSEYLKKLQGMPGWAKTNYHGAVPFDEVLKALSEASAAMVLLQPNYNTGGKLGTIGVTKLFEGMSAGIPVICTDFTLWKEVVEGYDCGICVPPDSRDELKKALQAIFSDPERAEAMGRNGRRAAEEKYNWGTQETILFELYRKLTEKLAG